MFFILFIMWILGLFIPLSLPFVANLKAIVPENTVDAGDIVIDVLEDQTEFARKMIV